MSIQKVGNFVLGVVALGAGVLLVVTTAYRLTAALRARANLESVRAAKAIPQRIDFMKTGFAQTTRTVLDECSASAKNGEIPSLAVVLSSYSPGSRQSVPAWQRLVSGVIEPENCVWIISFDDFSATRGLREAVERANGRFRLMVVADAVPFAVRTGLREVPATLLVDSAGIVSAFTVGEFSLGRAEKLIRNSVAHSSESSLDFVRLPNATHMYTLVK